MGEKSNNVFRSKTPLKVRRLKMFKQKVQQSVNDCIETNHIIKLWILLRATQEIEKMISCNEIN